VLSKFSTGAELREHVPDTCELRDVLDGAADGGRDAVGALPEAAEVACVLETAFACDLFDAQAGIVQKRGGQFELEALVILHRGQASGLFKAACEAAYAEVDCVGERLEQDWSGDVVDQVVLGLMHGGVQMCAVL
jgi:hypothetical protein